ncbi:hypothetical protein Mame01_01670 [Microbispora amethystogenes]|nr:hypothetical protein Mame01_01670 [Microbispora amethystogenes]
MGYGDGLAVGYGDGLARSPAVALAVAKPPGHPVVTTIASVAATPATPNRLDTALSMRTTSYRTGREATARYMWTHPPP